MKYKVNVLKTLERPDLPPSQKLFMVLRSDMIDPKTLRLFAVFCARKALNMLHGPRREDGPDHASIAACNVAERMAQGWATIDEIEQARQSASIVCNLSPVGWSWPADDAALAALDPSAEFAARKCSELMVKSAQAIAGRDAKRKNEANDIFNSRNIFEFFYKKIPDFIQRHNSENMHGDVLLEQVEHLKSLIMQKLLEDETNI